MTNELEKVEMPLMWNIIDSHTFQSRAQHVFDQVASVLRNTLGPYGTTTIIERAGDYHFTKDGWNVLKNIHFSDRIEESILRLIIDIAAQVVTRVGDGSTSSVVASSYLYEELKTIIGRERPKDIIRRLNNAVATLTEIIEKNATQIDKEDTTYEDIYRVAFISTNGDEKVARIIQRIYQETHNPDIEYRIGRNGDHGYQIIEGYQSPIRALDQVFLTNENNTGIYNDLITVLFDHRVDQSTHMEFLNDIIQYANEVQRPVFIAAHGYDKPMLEWIKNITHAAMNAGAPFGLIGGYAMLLNNIDHAMYHDLAVLTGGKVVTESTILAYNQMEYQQIEGTDQQELVRVNPDMNGKEYMGYVNTATVGVENTVLSGFPKVNENLLEIQRRDARNKLAEMEEREETHGVVNHDINRLRDRVSRLTCRVGIFNVGGHSTIERHAEKDLIEDAIKATASAFKHGYNIGNNLAVQNAVHEILTDETVDALDREIYTLIGKAFDSVLLDVYRNWDEEKANDGLLTEIKARALAANQTFDIVKGEYNQDIINPTRTDIEILHGAVSIISMIVSSNQYVSSMPEFIVK